ncbi:HAMP domain-containing histidine kinase [Candidatus Saccharibacteria bacterium]|nr:HAMP domain-containing histidine kinase [Candidatus Saccharibacteria bacterium]
MFKKLRNKLVFINLGITTIVIVIVFGMIYAMATGAANRRPPMPEQISVQTVSSEYEVDVEKIVSFTIKEEKEAAARDLLVTLIISGVMIEVAVLLVSYFLAEQAIKPVREAYESQKIFIANASHEIKTPLAAISANLEAADIAGNKWIDNIERETEKLTALNSELLTLARTDLVTSRPVESTNVAKILNDVVESYKPRLGQKKITQKISISKNIVINRGDLEQLIGIILDNALKYSKSKIIIEADEHSISISNDGATISDKDLPRVFDRFYQVDKSADGVGLGLSIAKSLADRNNWKLAAENGKMTKFILNF